MTSIDRVSVKGPEKSAIYRLCVWFWNDMPMQRSLRKSMRFHASRKPQTNTEFVEYAFGNGLRVDVPSDFNFQLPELKDDEGNV
jgi:beta-glucuronidase